MMRTMQSEDLGDPRLYEDEAIREQAARLQLHAGNLRKRIIANRAASYKTLKRLQSFEDLLGAIVSDVKNARLRNPL